VAGIAVSGGYMIANYSYSSAIFSVITCQDQYDSAVLQCGKLIDTGIDDFNQCMSRCEDFCPECPANLGNYDFTEASMCRERAQEDYEECTGEAMNLILWRVSKG